MMMMRFHIPSKNTRQGPVEVEVEARLAQSLEHTPGKFGAMTGLPSVGSITHSH